MHVVRYDKRRDGTKLRTVGLELCIRKDGNQCNRQDTVSMKHVSKHPFPNKKFSSTRANLCSVQTLSKATILPVMNRFRHKVTLFTLLQYQIENVLFFSVTVNCARWLLSQLNIMAFFFLGGGGGASVWLCLKMISAQTSEFLQNGLFLQPISTRISDLYHENN